MDTAPCLRCGTLLYADDEFCVGCGEPVSASRAGGSARARSRITRLEMALKTGAHAAIRSCGQCGGAVFPEDRFCQSCGGAVA